VVLEERKVGIDINKRSSLTFSFTFLLEEALLLDGKENNVAKESRIDCLRQSHRRNLHFL
jgi:hypothetical protein